MLQQDILVSALKWKFPKTDFGISNGKLVSWPGDTPQPNLTAVIKEYKEDPAVILKLAQPLKDVKEEQADAEYVRRALASGDWVVRSGKGDTELKASLRLAAIYSKLVSRDAAAAEEISRLHDKLDMLKDSIGEANTTAKVEKIDVTNNIHWV